MVNEEQKQRILTLLEHEEHHQQGAELAFTLGVPELIVEAMWDSDLEHWMALLHTAWSHSPALAAQGVVRGGELDKASTAGIAALLAAAPSRGEGLFSLGLKLAAHTWGAPDESMMERLQPCWAPGSDPERVRRISTALADADEDAWLVLFEQLEDSGQEEAATRAILINPLAAEEEVRERLSLSRSPVSRGLVAVLTGHPPAAWSHLLDWSEGLESVDDETLVVVMLRHLDHPAVCKAMLEALYDMGDDLIEQLVAVLRGPHPAGTRLAITQALAPAQLDRPELLTRLQAAAEHAPDDSARAATMDLALKVCPDRDRLQRALLRQLPDTLFLRQDRLAQLLQAPIPLDAAAQVRDTGDSSTLLALLGGLERAADPATAALIHPMADTNVLGEVSRRAAEVLGGLWSDPPEAGSLSLGLTLAAALAGAAHHARRLEYMAKRDDVAALAWCRLKTLQKETDALSPQRIFQAQCVEGELAEAWLEALTVQIFQGPMDTTRMTGLQRRQILALGDTAYRVVRDRIDEADEETQRLYLFVLSDRADWILDLVTKKRDRTWLDYARRFLHRLGDEALYDALIEDGHRLEAHAAFPGSLGRKTASWLSSALGVDKDDALVDAAVRYRRLPDGGVRVDPGDLKHSTHPAAVLKLLAGSGPIDPRRSDHQSATLRAVLPELVEDIAASQLWLKALLCASEPLLELTGWEPERIVDLAAHASHPHAAAAITALCKHDPARVIQYMPAALANAQPPGRFLDAVCAGASGMSAEALHEAAQRGNLAAICQGWLGVAPHEVVIDREEFSRGGRRTLDTLGAITLGDLLSHTASDLEKRHGTRMLWDLKRLLARYGLAMPEDPSSSH